MMENEEFEFIPEPEPEPQQSFTTQVTLPASVWSAMEVFTYFNQRQFVV